MKLRELRALPPPELHLPSLAPKKLSPSTLKMVLEKPLEGLQ